MKYQFEFKTDFSSFQDTWKYRILIDLDLLSYHLHSEIRENL